MSAWGGGVVTSPCVPEDGGREGARVPYQPSLDTSPLVAINQSQRPPGARSRDTEREPGASHPRLTDTNAPSSSLELYSSTAPCELEPRQAN